MFSSDNNRYIFDNEISNNFDELQEISQWASQVIDYSSSYGADNSISYSAINICNRPSKWPMYGDFAETYHMLNYGPSSDIEISMKDQNKLMTFHDFIIVKFEHFVLPKTIKIYETYNPGSIIRILSYCQIARRWKVLYESTPILTERKAREFCPEIYKIDTPTR
jgi:F-box and leucine-rich repeat protein 4